jgi:hypothetical protein
VAQGRVLLNPLKPESNPSAQRCQPRFLMGILIFKDLTERRLYKSFSVMFHPPAAIPNLFAALYSLSFAIDVKWHKSAVTNIFLTTRNRNHADAATQYPQLLSFPEDRRRHTAFSTKYKESFSFWKLQYSSTKVKLLNTESCTSINTNNHRPSEDVWIWKPCTKNRPRHCISQKEKFFITWREKGKTAMWRHL